MSFTYTTLKKTVQDYTQNTETSFISNIDTIIELAEERILKSVQLNVFNKNQSGTMSNTNQYLSCPSDFLSPLSLSVTNGNNHEFLLFKDLEFIQSFNPNAATTGVPKYYAQFDVNNFIIGPTPNANFIVNLSYFYRPVSLTQAGTISLELSNINGTFTTNDTITGATSGQSSKVTIPVSNSVLTVKIPTGDYVVGEQITGSSSSAFATIVSIGADTTTTWLSINAKIALLYATIVESYVYMKGDDNIMATYNKRLGEALSRLKNLGEALDVNDDYSLGPIVRERS